MLTAAAYAAGVVQNKELYRQLGVEPELVSIDFQKSLYDGGLIVFSEIAREFKLLIPYIASVAVVAGILFVWPRARRLIYLHKHTVLLAASIASYLLLVFVIYTVTITSFGRGRSLGGQLAEHLKQVCTLSSVEYDGGVHLELCTVGRTTDLLWFYDPKTEKAVAFGKEKIIKLISGG